MSVSRVLLIDDEEDLRLSTAQALELAGLDVVTIDNADHVFELIGYSFDGVIVSDIRMPGIDGMSLLQKVRELDAEIPVILVTGHGDVQLAVSAMRNGAYDFIEKPFSIQYLAASSNAPWIGVLWCWKIGACARLPENVTIWKRACQAARR